jgi:hypothetical protein
VQQAGAPGGEQAAAVVGDRVVQPVRAERAVPGVGGQHQVPAEPVRRTVHTGQ